MQLDKAMQEQANQKQWQAAVKDAYKPTYAQAPFGQQQETQLAEQIGDFPDFKDAARLTMESGSPAQMQTGMQFDQKAMQMAMPYAPASLQDELMRSIIPKEKAPLIVGDTVLDPTTYKPLFTGSKKPEVPSDLRTVASLLGLPNDPATWNDSQRKLAGDELVKIKQSGAPSFSNYGSPVAGQMQGKPVFFQPSPRGGPPVVMEGIEPPPRKESESKAPAGFRFTEDGNMEAIPGGPADLKAQAMAQRIADGSVDVDVAITGLRDAYDRLDKGGGITSTSNRPLTNLAASASSSDIGQGIGKMFGTANQSARNDIAMARPALLAALMKATGMSAKQMDSNAELKLWLSTATDPTLDVESNRKALANIEKKYMSGNKQNYPSPNTQAINRLKMNKNNKAEIEMFEQIFGQGSSSKYMR